MKFKVLTLNIHKGFSLWNQKLIMEELKSHIRDLGADLVLLQEVLGQHQEYALQSQFEFLADEIWDHYAYGKNAAYSKGHHGNAILSHFPFSHYENIDISNHRFERRGILYGVVSCPEWKERRLHVMTVHLDLLSWGRKKQIDRLCRLVEERVPLGEPLLVAGDFNDWREELSLVLGARLGLKETHLTLKGAHAQTFPSKYPILRLDRIYARGLEMEAVSCLSGAPWSELSDHLALFAEMRIP
jgi:hypothetical protein